MPPRQRIMAIRLTDKINKNPKYAENLGIVSNFKNIDYKKQTEVQNEQQYSR